MEPNYWPPSGAMCEHTTEHTNHAASSHLPLFILHAHPTHPHTPHTSACILLTSHTVHVQIHYTCLTHVHTAYVHMPQGRAHTVHTDARMFVIGNMLTEHTTHMSHTPHTHHTCYATRHTYHTPRNACRIFTRSTHTPHNTHTPHTERMCTAQTYFTHTHLSPCATPACPAWACTHRICAPSLPQAGPGTGASPSSVAPIPGHEADDSGLRHGLTRTEKGRGLYFSQSGLRTQSIYICKRPGFTSLYSQCL